ncbi:hypothetical protein ES702_06280 [subsurface metagenome]
MNKFSYRWKYSMPDYNCNEEVGLDRVKRWLRMSYSAHCYVLNEARRQTEETGEVSIIAISIPCGNGKKKHYGVIEIKCLDSRR